MLSLTSSADRKPRNPCTVAAQLSPWVSQVKYRPALNLLLATGFLATLEAVTYLRYYFCVSKRIRGTRLATRRSLVDCSTLQHVRVVVAGKHRKE